MKLRRTPAIDYALTHNPHADRDRSGTGEGWVEHRLAISLGKQSGVPLAQFLSGTSVYTMPNEGKSPPPKSAEYVALMEKLRRDEAERSYRELVGAAEGSPESLAQITKEINSQITTIFNVLVSIGAVGWAFWYWTSSWPLASRTLISLFAGMFTGVAEVVVFLGYKRRVEQTKNREVIEKTEILEEFVFIGRQEKSENSTWFNGKISSQGTEKEKIGLRKRETRNYKKHGSI